MSPSFAARTSLTEGQVQSPGLRLEDSRRGFPRVASWKTAPWTSHFSTPRHSGGALVMVMILVCVLSVVAGALLLTTTMRYHTVFQSASWQESVVGAEAGIDLAMNELRKRVMQGPGASFQTNWTVLAPTGSTYSDYGHAFPDTSQSYLLGTHGGEGNSSLRARVYLDVPGSGSAPNYTTKNFAISPSDAGSSFISQQDNPKLRDPDNVDRTRWWYRIRALGIANLAGPPQPNLEKLDNRLRHFSFFTDWRTGQSVTTPEVARLVEVIVRPETNFRNALMADKRIDLSNVNVLVDSYDSSKGQYSSTANHGTMGNIATNGTLINASHATVNGDAMTNNGTVNDGDKVTGQQSANFYQELTPLTAGMLNPAWSGVKDDGTITTDAAYTASIDPTNPTTVRLDGINLPGGGHVLSLNGPAATTVAPKGAAPPIPPSFIKIYVQGDITTNDDSYIDVAAGVNAIFYFTGNVNLQGAGIFNDSLLARQLVLNGVQPPANPDGTFPDRSITIATYQDFEGIIYAPNHDLDLALTAATAATSGGSGPVTTVTGAVNKQIQNLQKKLNKAQDDYNKAVAKYQEDAAAYQNGNFSKWYEMQKDLQDEQRAQAQVTQLQAQIKQLGGDPDSSQTADHIQGYNGIYGGFVGRTIKVENKTHIHYDETLRQAGPVNHYEIVSWFEDNISRDATGGTELFWWPSAKK